MNALVKIPKVLHEDLVTLRKFYDDVESHVRSLKNLGVESESYGSLLSTVVMDKLPEEIKLIVSRNIKQDTCTLTNVLNVINAELRARESCTIPDASQDGKNVGFSNYTCSSLHSSHSRHSDSPSHFKRSSGKPQSLVCAFCKGNHWADKCNVISDVDSRKDFLRKGKLCFMCLRPDHISRNCKGMHNSSICNNRDKNSETKPDENNKVSTNCASNISSVVLQTAEILVENPINKKQVKVKVLFDQGSQKSYLTQRIKRVLSLNPVGCENISISTFGNEVPERSRLDRVIINLKNKENKIFEIEALCKDFICLPIKNQPINLVKSKFEFLNNLQLADSGYSEEIHLSIGSDFYWSIVTGAVKVGKIGEPAGVESEFGWLLNGPLTCEKTVSSNLSIVHETSSHILFTKSDETEKSDLEGSLHKYWDLETLGIREDEKTVTEDFYDSIYVNEEGRYEAKLPFKENTSNFT